MVRKAPSRKGGQSAAAPTPAASVARPSALLDARIIYCGDCLDQLSSEPRPSGSGLLPKLPDGCVDLIYIDPPFNSNRNYEVFWGEAREKRAFEDRHASTKAYIDYMRPRGVPKYTCYYAVSSRACEHKSRPLDLSTLATIGVS